MIFPNDFSQWKWSNINRKPNLFLWEAAKRGRYTHERRALIVEDARRVEDSKSSFLPQDPVSRKQYLEALVRTLTAVDRKYSEHTTDFYQSIPLLEAAFMVKYNHTNSQSFIIHSTGFCACEFLWTNGLWRRWLLRMCMMWLHLKANPHKPRHKPHWRIPWISPCPTTDVRSKMVTERLSKNTWLSLLSMFLHV